MEKKYLRSRGRNGIWIVVCVVLVARVWKRNVRSDGGTVLDVWVGIRTSKRLRVRLGNARYNYVKVNGK